jgi:hypothetical protein
MTDSSAPGADRGPLSPEQQRQLAEANQRARKIMGAARMAAFNGWTIGSIAAVSVLFGLFSRTALVMGIAMGFVAWNEFRGRTLLRAFDPEGARLLGKNQVGLLVVIVIYCLWSIYITTTGENPEMAEIEAMIGDISDLVTELTVMVYGIVIGVSVLFQGLNARYYFARQRLIREYVQQTPDWVVKLQRSTSVY